MCPLRHRMPYSTSVMPPVLRHAVITAHRRPSPLSAPPAAWTVHVRTARYTLHAAIEGAITTCILLYNSLARWSNRTPPSRLPPLPAQSPSVRPLTFRFIHCTARTLITSGTSAHAKSTRRNKKSVPPSLALPAAMKESQQLFHHTYLQNVHSPLHDTQYNVRPTTMRAHLLAAKYTAVRDLLQ